MSQTQLLSTRQVAERLGLKQRTILGYIKSGNLPAFDVSSGARAVPLYRVTEADLEAWIVERKAAA